MMLYLVRVAVDKAAHEEWLTWMLDHHLPDVLDTGCFLGADACRDAERDTPGRVAWTFVYRVRDEAAWTTYTREHAPALQADHTSRFSGRFEASRELLPVVRAFSGPDAS